jgi:hypothetical protein
MTANSVRARVLVALATVCGACGVNAPLDTQPPASSAAAGTSGAAAGASGAATETTSAAAGASGGSSKALPIPSAEALTRVAALLWQQPPELPGGDLATTADLARAVRAMLADPRASNGVGAFYRWWLDLDQVATLTKDPMLFPAFTPALQADMSAETLAFALDVTIASDGSFQTLMTANWSFVNARLADIYGLGGVAGDGLRKVSLPADQRAGLLTQPALQALGSYATRNGPVHRGAYIDNKLFCTNVPPPPPGVPDVALPLPGETLRRSLETSAVDGGGACQACHTLLDPQGLAFESYDAIGRWRTIDNGEPVDTSNLTIRMLGSPTGEPITVNGPIELAKDLADDKGVQQCFARKWLSFAVGRELTDADKPSLVDIDTAFATSGFNLQALIAAVLTSDTFLTP